MADNTLWPIIDIVLYIYIYIYEHEAIKKSISENNIGAPLAPQNPGNFEARLFLSGICSLAFKGSLQ